MNDARTGRTRGGLALVWLLAGAGLGSLAGLPWIWYACGPVPACLFAALAAAEALRLYRSRAASDARFGVAAAWGIPAAAVAFVFGNPSSYSWLDRCFNPWGTEREPIEWRQVAGVLGFMVFVLLVLELQRRGRVLGTLLNAGTEEGRDRALFRSAVWLATAAVAWSVVNELTFTNIIRDFRTGPCEPDVGRVALLGYSVAVSCLVYLVPRAARRRRMRLDLPPPPSAEHSGAVSRSSDEGAEGTPNRGPTPAALGLASAGGPREVAPATARFWLVTAALCCAAGLLVGQSVRCTIFFHDRQKELERCGGPAACHCADCSWWEWQ